MNQYTANLKSDDPDIAKRRVSGWYCEVEGQSFIIPDDAEICTDDAIIGVVEVQKETISLKSPH